MVEDTSSHSASNCVISERRDSSRLAISMLFLFRALVAGEGLLEIRDFHFEPCDFVFNGALALFHLAVI